MKKALAESQGGPQALAHSQSVEQQEAEKRISEEDGKAYTFKEFVRWFGQVDADVQWKKSQSLAASQPNKTERRFSQDGIAYTYEEFVYFFGVPEGSEHWHSAVPAASNKTGDTKSSSEHPEMPKTPLACAEPPSDHDQQQQDAKDTLEL